MSDIVRLHLQCVPPTTTHHAKKVIRLKTRDGKQFSKLADTPELVKAKAMLDSLLLPHQGVTVPSPVALSFVFTWPWLSTARKRDMAKGRIPHTSRPDCSNLAKTLEDRLVALRFIEDDNAVVVLRVQKWWGDAPGIDIAIAPFAHERQEWDQDLFAGLEELPA